MDAKPHRPFRTLKLRDENLPPSILPSKSIHQRNKSSPALSSLAQVGNLRFGARRTAFADVSNTTRPLATIRDDTALPNKHATIGNIKLGTGKDVEKPAPLQRAAQRPLSISGIKGFLNTFALQSQLNRPPPTANVSSTLPELVPARKPLPKKSTIVFKEATVAPEKVEVQIPILEALNEGLLEQPITQAAESQLLAYLTQPQPAPALSELEQTSITQPREASLRPSTAHSVSVVEPAVEPILETVLAPFNPAPEVDLQHVRAFENVDIYEDAVDQLPLPLETTALANNDQSRPGTAVQHPVVQPYNPEQEFGEYWDDEYEKSDDAGYTTARSIKVGDDYTTGVTTTVLAPRLTPLVQQELDAAAEFVLSSKTAEEIEDDECWDTSMVAEYGDEIFQYMRNLEEKMQPNPYYMDNQTEVQWSMRSVLMDWLVQVHHRFSLLPETLFLCVNYIDRFLSCKVVSLGKLQLVGATAIFIAAKYEEINCPSIQEIVYMVDGGYTVDEILKAERFMLSMLQFELGWPGPMSFLRRISKADDYDLETRTLAKYFLEITIMDERFVACTPSFTAAGAHCLARLMLKKGIWSQAHVYYSQYTYSQLRPLLSAMLSCCEDPQKHHVAVFDKYSDKRFKRASYFVQTEMQKGFRLPALARANTCSLGYSSEFASQDWREILRVAGAAEAY